MESALTYSERSGSHLGSNVERMAYRERYERIQAPPVSVVGARAIVVPLAEILILSIADPNAVKFGTTNTFRLLSLIKWTDAYCLDIYNLLVGIPFPAPQYLYVSVIKFPI